MTTARVTSRPPLNDWIEGSTRRMLGRELVVDLGVNIPELWGFDGISDRSLPGGPTIVAVPEGFDHDGSSNPPVFGWLLGDEDNYEVAGIVHDYLYRIGVPRGVADGVWRLIARSGKHHVGPVRGFFGWAGLRLGGWVAYRRLRQERESR